MFVHESHLSQVLNAAEYTSTEQLEREKSTLFQSGWQFIGTLEDLPNDGDFFTFELFENPLIVWKIDGQVHTFLNVCPHRFSMLSHQPCGHAGNRLRCQYHGWEFDRAGGTRKIPDSKSFRPMEQGALGLIKYQTETVGKLIFVNLTENHPSLADYLGPGYQVAQELFAPERRLFLSMDYEVACNWKIKIENSLESYHVDLVHPKTFIETPDEKVCEHVLQPRWTQFTTQQPAATRFNLWMDDKIHQFTGLENDGQYRHYHFYPSMMYGKMSVFSFAETVFPISPDRTRILAKFFCYPGQPGTLKTRIAYRALGHWGKKFWSIVAQEDVNVMPDIHKGMVAPQLPSEGLISVREERLFHFQEYIKRATSNGVLTEEPVHV